MMLHQPHSEPIVKFPKGNPVEDGEVERLVRLLASVGYPADHVLRLQQGHIALDDVLVQGG